MKRKLVLALVLFFFVVFPLHAEVAQEPEGRYFDSNGVKIHYVVMGDGEPVVLVHGFTMDYKSEWGGCGLLGPLSERYKVIAIDNRGHGKSGKPHDPKMYGTEMVKDIVRLLDYLEIDKAHIAGYSMGGFITVKLLTMYPERIQSAVIGGAGWRKDFGDREGIWVGLADSLEKGEGFGPLIAALTPEGQPLPTEEQVAAMSALITARNDLKALAAVIRGMREAMVTEEELRANKVPALSIIGGIDPLKADADALKEVMANLEVVVIEGADHPGCIASPKFRESMLEFLAKHSRAPAEPAGVGSR